MLMIVTSYMPGMGEAHRDTGPALLHPILIHIHPSRITRKYPANTTGMGEAHTGITLALLHPILIRSNAGRITRRWAVNTPADSARAELHIHREPVCDPPAHVPGTIAETSAAAEG